MVVCDPEYPKSLTQGNSYKISVECVKWAWNWVMLHARQRIYFENNSRVTKTAGQILGRQMPDAADERDDFDVLDHDPIELVSLP